MKRESSVVGADDITASSIAGMVTFDAATLQINVLYATDNEFDGNSYTLTREESSPTTTQTNDVTLQVKENCIYATMVAPGDGIVHSYTVSDKGSNDYI